MMQFGGPSQSKTDDFEFLWFSQLLGRAVSYGEGSNQAGKLSDLVFRLAEPHPEAVGIYLEHGWGKPTEFIPWDRILRIEGKAITVKAPEGAETYPPFVDQPGWILLGQHLMGRTILDIDGRKSEVVNDVHLLYSKGRMIIVHVDVSLNGFLRKWGLGSIHWIQDRLISWHYVQPFSVEDAVTTDSMTLSVKKEQALDLPGEDLADVLETLSGKEQEAFFSALDSEKAAETLTHAEPRAKRQLVASLRKEKARTILSELSVPQLADLFSVLPHDDVAELLYMLPEGRASKLKRIISEREATARQMISHEYMTFRAEDTVGKVLQQIRTSGHEHSAISYVYIVDDRQTLVGVADLRELILAQDSAPLDDLMVTSVVAAEEDDNREDLAELFAKYHYRMIPVVDVGDHILGVIHFNDIMEGLSTRVKS
jgi:CBS domain-containing protein/sporulation protein YlmC with PRC-barrel domain